MIFYTDGSAHPNPGPGGFGVVGIEDDKITFVKSYQCNKTTNNEMELQAILYTMLNYGIKEDEWFQPPIVYSDSAYAVNTFNTWMFNWAKNNWIKSDKKIPENLEIIKEYYNYYNKGYRIDLRKIKGHAGNRYNELADQLATGKILESDILKGE
jgi:ribonuclease HI